MFTINIHLRFALMGILTLGGIALSAAFGFWYGFPFILFGVALTVGYVLLGTVQSAAEIMQTGDMVAATKRLNLTLKPEWLYVTNRAYYYMLKGTMAMSDKRTDEGEIYLNKAQALKLPTDNEKAMIELQLASIKANKGKIKEAEAHLRNLKQLKVTESMIKNQIEEFDKALKQNKGQLNAANRMGAMRGQMMQKGGGSNKRRRPPMR
jgi:tetratricopeptide (TPR) repeat protein